MPVINKLDKLHVLFFSHHKMSCPSLPSPANTFSSNCKDKDHEDRQVYLCRKESRRIQLQEFVLEASLGTYFQISHGNSSRSPARSGRAAEGRQHRGDVGLWELGNRRQARGNYLLLSGLLEYLCFVAGRGRGTTQQAAGQARTGGHSQGAPRRGPAEAPALSRPRAGCGRAGSKTGRTGHC